MYFIALLGLSILTGYSGQISLGHGAFMAIGGYTTAILTIDHGVRDLWTIPIAGLVAGVAGLVVGVPALRLSGLYLALITFGIAVSFRQIPVKFDHFFGGTTGKVLGLLKTPFGLSATPEDWIYYLTWGIAFVLLVVAWLFVRGKPGRTLKAIRDSEIAAASSGISIARYKMLAFGMSAFYAGRGSVVRDRARVYEPRRLSDHPLCLPGRGARAGRYRLVRRPDSRRDDHLRPHQPRRRRHRLAQPPPGREPRLEAAGNARRDLRRRSDPRPHHPADGRRRRLTPGLRPANNAAVQWVLGWW
jgi:hypothetical protein